MHRVLGLITAIVLLASPLAGSVRDACADLNDVAKALGASTGKSIEFTGTGLSTRPGRADGPGGAWPKFNVKSLTRSINYDTGFDARLHRCGRRRGIRRAAVACSRCVASSG